ncbi:2-dehydro-3-deoxygalactonokinase [Acidimangrovimonas sediminis]|uniref:2-dehydro-3-deoxygalactonokinase n=1 Tax=Acidimangrovimonas sediminis TaxID=2056283 RepID=UPI000C7F973C|nr:2-dehydro-3-deoxygalactonokinase [Acidimangrovimonas sediminis]
MIPDVSRPAAGEGQVVADWIAVDWGTSNLRLWALDAGGAVLAERGSDRGMGRLSPGEYEAALLDLAAPYLAEGRVTEVLVCGMAGARQGWIEAPYQPVPCIPDGRGAVSAPTADPRLAVRILPGMSQSSPPDVLRGEETQIAGFLRSRPDSAPDFDGVLCLPGTHGKWARVSGGAVQALRTAMTGEMHALLSTQSVLRHSMQGAVDAGTFDHGAFAAALDEIAAAPATLTAALFGIRARGLLESVAPGTAAARLSGLLIGAELAAMRDLWQGRPVIVIGAPELSARYCEALARAGAEAEAMPGAGLVLAGLAAAREAGRSAGSDAGNDTGNHAGNDAGNDTGRGPGKDRT